MLLVCGFVFSPDSVGADTGPNVEEQGGRNGKHRYSLRLVQGPFRPSRHKVAEVDLGGWKAVTVNGIIVRGTSGHNAPRTEVYAFELTVDGKRWRIPRKLWADLYNPNFGRSPSSHLHPRGNPNVTSWMSSDGSRVYVSMSGSDASAAYRVLWTLRRNGRHSRRFVGPDAMQDAEYLRSDAVPIR